MKVIMLIQHAEKKRYEMSKWSFGNAILMTDWNTTCFCSLPYEHFISIEIPDRAWKKMKYWIMCKLSKVCAIFITAVVANYLPNIGSWDIVTEQIVSKKT